MVLRRMVAPALVVAGVAIGCAASTGQAEPATVGRIAVSLANRAYTIRPDGTDPQPLNNSASGRVAWSPDGSRYAYVDPADHRLKTSRPGDDASSVVLTDGNGTVTAPVWTTDGSLLIYVLDGHLHRVSSDGGGLISGPLFPIETGVTDSEPAAGPNGTVVFTRGTAGAPSLYRYDPWSGAVAELVAGASQASYPPDGQRLAFVAPDPRTGAPQVFTAGPAGANPVRLTTEGGAGAAQPAWSPDATSLLYVSRSGADSGPVKRIVVATGAVSTVAPDGLSASWQPVVVNDVTRVWGQDHIDTAVATSRYNFADHGAADVGRRPAGAVVLSRDDTYLDALVGSAFAIKERAPLLVTNRLTLDPRVQREIGRVLGGAGTVYLLGGELALTRAVENQLGALGYTVERIWGQTHFDTAIEVDKRLTTQPYFAIVATGVNYYDALAAGAVAGANPGAVIVLTDGDTMPAVSAAYLNSLNPNVTAGGAAIVTAGGPGDRALTNARNAGLLPNWPAQVQRWSLVGQNEKDTALRIAEFFYPAPGTAAVATSRAWYDGLTGGAMIGTRRGPLLITDPAGLYPGVARYLARRTGSLDGVVLLGGPVALPEPLQGATAEQVSLPGAWRYASVT